MMKLTLGVKAFVAIVGAAIIYAVLSHFNLVPAAIRQKAEVPKQFDLPTEAPVTAATPVRVSGSAEYLPSTSPASCRGARIRIETIPWNGTAGLHYAVGGRQTMKGSLAEKRGLCVELKMVMDSAVSRQAQVKFAQAMANGADTPPDGPAFVIIMGDSAPQYIAAFNKAVEKLGSDYYVENVGHVGYSRGEDGFWGPAEWKDNPAAAKGGLVAGVLLDGDWDDALYWAAQNDIKNNPDERSWAADALNWVAADDFMKAVEMYVSGYCENRPVVKDGKLTGEKKNVCVQGVVTWTPGDVTLARKKGGLTRIISTKELPTQMPATLIGVHKWNMAHAKQVEDLLAASYDGGVQVKAHDDALQAAAKAQHQVYGIESAGYWARYYRGTRERDHTGQPVELGGSAVADLNDVAVYYGLAQGTGGPDNSLWKATYEGFGRIQKQQYPRRVADYPAYDKAFNPRFIQALLDKTMVDVAKADMPTFSDAPIEKSDVVARRSWTINFETGKATFTPDAQRTLSELYTTLLQGGGMAVEIDGHTDNVGNPTVNQPLSQARAEAVKSWLETKAPALFPAGRVQTKGFGDSKPVAPNGTPDGRARNRRVEIVLGVKS